jgi:serine/threonine protein kinase
MLEENFNLLKEISKKNFVSIYLLEDKNSLEKFIVKKFIVYPEFKNLEKTILAEANLLKSLSHKNIPKFIRLDKEELNEKIYYYLFQEYIEGNNLKELVENNKFFTEEEVLDIALQITDVLIYLHSHSPQILHLDIKPSNIILSKNNIAYLIDFGAFNKKELEDISSKGLSTIIGTQGYMPIEQFEGKPVQASDIYSLGLTLVYLITHKEPLELNRNNLKIEFSANVSNYFKKVLEKMIEIDKDKRFQTSLELKEELENSKKMRNIKYISFDKDLNLPDKLKSYLYENEKIVYLTKPNPKYFLKIKNFGIYLFAIPWTAFALFWTAMASMVLKKSVWFFPFPMFGIPFIVVGIFMLYSPFLKYKQSKDSIYLITNRRLILYLSPKTYTNLHNDCNFKTNYKIYI